MRLVAKMALAKKAIALARNEVLGVANPVVELVVDVTKHGKRVILWMEWDVVKSGEGLVFRT